jgi:hypothetical protein
VHELAFELVHAENDRTQPRRQRLGRRLEGIVFDFDHVTDLIGQQTHRALCGANHQAHRQHAGGTVGHLQLAAQFEDHDHLPAQVHQAADRRRRQRNGAHFAVRDHLLDLERLHSKEQMI